jgi:hypothetical protein
MLSKLKPRQILIDVMEQLIKIIGTRTIIKLIQNYPCSGIGELRTYANIPFGRLR